MNPVYTATAKVFGLYHPGTVCVHLATNLMNTSLDVEVFTLLNQFLMCLLKWYDHVYNCNMRVSLWKHIIPIRNNLRKPQPTFQAFSCLVEGCIKNILHICGFLFQAGYLLRYTDKRLNHQAFVICIIVHKKCKRKIVRFLTIRKIDNM